jgi:hypothetical protein
VLKSQKFVKQRRKVREHFSPQKPVGFLKFLSRKLPSILFAISINRFEGTENDTISSGIKFLIF